MFSKKIHTRNISTWTKVKINYKIYLEKNTNFSATIGVDFMIKTVKVGNDKIKVFFINKFSFWDRKK